MDFDQIKKYWDERAAADSSAQSTTQDFFLREIEFRVLKDLIARYMPAIVMDVGCGDARTTARLASEFGHVKFLACDYAESMAKNARDNVIRAGIDNLKVIMCDVSNPLPAERLDMIYSIRCLINLPTWELQKTALRNIADALAARRHFVMIENFIEGHEQFNRVRREYGLPEIPVRSHNLFFSRSALLEHAAACFRVLEEVNISSTYYLVSRIIYSKLCADKHVDPDYFDAHHQYAAQLPFAGEYGPVRMMCMSKKA